MPIANFAKARNARQKMQIKFLVVPFLFFLGLGELGDVFLRHPSSFLPLAGTFTDSTFQRTLRTAMGDEL